MLVLCLSLSSSCEWAPCEGCDLLIFRSSSAPQSRTANIFPRFRFRLLERRAASPDSWMLRFALPHGLRTLTPDPTQPTGLKVLHNGVEKSYSPISHPAEQGICDLLVKHYAPLPGGGVSDALCLLEPGQEAEMKIKPPRSIHGSPFVANRWRRMGLLSCGTGIAPFVQILRILRLDPTDRTAIRLLSVNRSVDGILLKDEIDHLAADWPGGRLKVTYSLTGSPVSSGWPGLTGRGSHAMARDVLPLPGSDGGSNVVLVCGTDGFVESWAGPRWQRHTGAHGREVKLQGPLGGLLQEAGFREDEVYKY